MYQSVIIVPPRASVDIKGATDKTSREALHRKPFTLTPVLFLSCRFRISLNDIPLLESLENNPGVVFLPVTGLVKFLFGVLMAIVSVKLILSGYTSISSDGD